MSWGWCFSFSRNSQSRCQLHKTLCKRAIQTHSCTFHCCPWTLSKGGQGSSRSLTLSLTAMICIWDEGWDRGRPRSSASNAMLHSCDLYHLHSLEQSRSRLHRGSAWQSSQHCWWNLPRFRPRGGFDWESIFPWGAHTRAGKACRCDSPRLSASKRCWTFRRRRT